MNETIQTDALERLEWFKLTQHLAQFAQLQSTKKRLAILNPFLDNESRVFFLEATREMGDLLFQEGIFEFGTFEEELFLPVLKRMGLVSPIGLHHIFKMLQSSFGIASFFTHQKKSNDRCPLLFKLSNQLFLEKNLEKRLAISVDEEGQILSSASPGLLKARQNVNRHKQKIEEILADYIKKNQVRELLQDSSWMYKEGRYVLPVRVEYKNQIPGVARGFSQSGATIFIEPSRLAQEQADLEQSLQDVLLEENLVIKELSESCSLYADEFSLCCQTLGQFDEILARARLAHRLGGQPGVLLDARSSTTVRFSLLKARHPLFILENKPCVPNDLELVADPGQTEAPFVWVLSGPNAGGKTVAMKTVGLHILMMRCGLFVPSSKAEALSYEQIFVELGDRQNRAEDLSSFSGHLQQMQGILQSANEKTLILLDEGFVGTDPAMGVALARAALEYCAQLQSTVIMTTHFSGLKNLSSQNSTFATASMSFEPKNLSPTYKILPGVPGQSYAIELATRMGLPKDILEKARYYYGIEKEAVDKLADDLRIKNEKLEEKIQTCEHLTLELQKTLRELESIKHDYDKNKTLAPLDQITQKSKKMVSWVKDQSVEIPAQFWQKEMRVKCSLFSDAGIVLTNANGEGFVSCQFGMIKTKIHHSQLTQQGSSTASPPKKKLVQNTPLLKQGNERSKGPNTLNHDIASVLPHSGNTLDLRGCLVDEALGLLDRQIHHFWQQGLACMVVIHGHGTGKVKEAVRLFLVTCPIPLGFRPGRPGEGGDGVSVIAFQDE